MNIAFYGFNKYSYGLAKLMCSTSAHDSLIKVTGMLGKNTTATVNAAIHTNTKAYSSLDDLVKEADVIILGHADSMLSEVSLTLKEKNVKNKILCHLSQTQDSRIISCGITNTCYSISFPLCYDTTKMPELANCPIVFEGGGRKSEEFETAMKSALPNCIFTTKSNRNISLLAKRIMTVHMTTMIKVGRWLCKISGIYDEKAFNTFALNITMDMLSKNPVGTCDARISETELRKYISLLNTINEPGLKEYYRHLEQYAMEDVAYSGEQRYMYSRILGKK